MAQVLCKICNKEFYAKPNHIERGWGKYCSKKCQSKAQMKGEFVNCEGCGIKIWRTPRDFRKSKSGKFFCNKSCQTIWRNKYFSGSKHPNWQGGVGIDYRKILMETKIKFACKICGIQDKRIIIAHHIDKNRRNHNIDNLIWLCLNCHYLVHHHNKFVK